MDGTNVDSITEGATIQARADSDDRVSNGREQFEEQPQRQYTDDELSAVRRVE